LDAFFVEVCRRHDPALRDVELLVVGGKRHSRGVVQSASYGARKYGIRSGMPIAEAVRRCPQATFTSGGFGWYRDASRQVRAVLEKFAPVVVMTGLDEGYLDLSGTDLLHPVSLLDFATAIRTAVHEESGLDCSIGIGPNRMIAKIASDYAKPRGICEVRAGWERGFLAGLPLKALPGIGPRTAERLAVRGLEEVHQVQHMPHDELVRLLGRDEAMVLSRRVEGRGGTTLVRREQPVSISRETTFNRDISDAEELDRVLLLLSSRVTAQLRDEELVASTVVLKLRHHDFTTITRRITLDHPTDLDQPIRDTARKLLAPAFRDARRNNKSVRLLGVAVTNLQPAGHPELFTDPETARNQSVTRAVDAVRSKYGFDAVKPGRLVKKGDGKREKGE
ncbi:MAG TPA: DNA polymerase IV, partial [Gemmatimonadales bacterium]|nr:DNA polymerase IV [Gemmatimonadales bacterium]